jgi:Ca2+-binding EF-hand superfamily protein
MATAGRAAIAAQQRRKRIEENAKKEDELVRSWFAEYDKSRTGQFERAEMKSLLTAVKRQATNNPEAEEVQDKLLDKIMKRYATPGADGAEDGVKRDDAAKAVQRYKSLLKQEEALKDLFAKADKDHSNLLTRDELKVFLAAAAELRGNYIQPSDSDLDFILERCDASKDGKIDLDEAGPAVALWYTCLPPPKPKSIFSLCFPSKKKTAKVAVS